MRQNTPDSLLQVLLHAVYLDVWDVARNRGQPGRRLRGLSLRFQLSLRSEEPWLHYLYLGQIVASKMRSITDLSS